MRDWKRIVDRLTQDVIGDGDVSKLPGAGKPLDLQDSAHTPADQRTAFKIMQDHNVIPDWMNMGKELDKREEELRRQAISRAATYQQALATARAQGRPTDEARIERAWQQYVRTCGAAIESYNRQARLYNLKIPNGLPHKKLLNSQAIIQAALQT